MVEILWRPILRTTHRKSRVVGYPIPSGSPPTLLLQGSSDHLVLAEHTAAYAAASASAGVPQRNVELPSSDHAFGITELDADAQVTRELTRPWPAEYLT
ncbi:hypothetical protein AB0346_31135 [Nocardia beijingensis]|uniref:hypothetical protein n=1 Tax=Nocardia beijingensis TaxID=95162 RepID=UPI00344DA0FF